VLQNADDSFFESMSPVWAYGEVEPKLFAELTLLHGYVIEVSDGLEIRLAAGAGLLWLRYRAERYTGVVKHFDSDETYWGLSVHVPIELRFAATDSLRVLLSVGYRQYITPFHEELVSGAVDEQYTGHLALVTARAGIQVYF
jgi:hypothetical protein